MCKKHLRSSRGIPLFAILFTLCFQFLSMNSASAQVLACNSGVQISLDQNCEGLLTPDFILEGSYPGADSDYLIEVSNGTSGIGSIALTGKGTFNVTITYVPTGQSCWGNNYVVEDKLAPVITGATCSTSLSGSVDPTNLIQGDASGSCAASFAGLPVSLQDEINDAGGLTSLAYDLVPFTVNTMSDYELSPMNVGSDCYYLFAAFQAGTFDPANPCQGFMLNTLGYQAGSSSVTFFNMSNLPAGDYEMLFIVFPSSCGYNLNMTSTDVCPQYCTQYDAFVAGTSSITAQPVVTENCNDYTCVYTDVPTGDMCNLTMTRTWICEDACGNVSASFDQTFNFGPVGLTDVVAPDATVDLSCGVELSPQGIYDYLIGNGTSADAATSAAWPTFDGAALDGTVCNLAVTYTDQEFPVCGVGCTGNTKVIRTWSVYDWCNGGVSLDYTQIIKAQDQEVPTITFNTTEYTISTNPWGCSGTFIAPEPDIVHDNCDFSPTYEFHGPTGSVLSGNSISGLAIGTHTITYVASDCCGNTSSTQVTVNVEDSTPPVAVAVQNIVVTLTNDGNGGLAKLYTNSVDNGSHDGCSAVSFEIRRDTDNCDVDGNTTYNNNGDPQDANTDPDDGQSVKFCCEDVYGATGVDEDGDGLNDYGIVQVWLRVFDASGNYNETWTEVRVEDKLAPALICPADITIDCDVSSDDMDVTGVAVAYNACNNATVDFVDVNGFDSCNSGLLRRKWFVVGNPSIFCIQRITKQAGSPFSGTDINWPQDVDTDCTDLGFTGIPTYSAGACDLVAYSMESDTFLFDTGACLKILNTFTVIDWCQYEPNAEVGDANYGLGIWSHTQTIKVNDDDAPVITCTDEMFEVNDHNDADNDGEICEAIGIVLANSAVDNGACSSDYLRWEIEIDLWADGIIDHVYTSNLPSNSPYYVAPTSNGEFVSITLGDIQGSMSNHKAVWKVSDGCGNVTSCTQNFMVVDKTAPTPYCVNISTALMENGTVDLWAIDFDLGAYDNCSDQEDLRFTFSSINPTNDPSFIPSLSSSAHTFNCDDLPETPGEPVALNVYVWDEKDNSAFCTVYLTLIDNLDNCGVGTLTAPIAGRIATEEGEVIEDVEMELSTDAIIGFPLNQMTNTSGNYAFYNNPMYLDYEVQGSKNDDYMNGVSTLDLVLIQKHLLGVSSLNSPYKVIAADINSDANVSAIDLIELRKLILGIYLELPSNDSWRFVDADDAWVDSSSPFPFNEILDLDNLTTSMTTEDFVGVKIGDVNNTVAVNLDQNSDNRSDDEFNFVVEEQEFTAGETVKIEVKSQEALELLGFQFTMNTSALTLSRIDAGVLNVSSENFAVHNGFITSSWNEINSANTDQGDVLFTMIFTAQRAGKLSSDLNFTNSVTRSEVYSENGNVTEELKLLVRTGTEYADAGYKLYQNEPNPFLNETTIGFDLPVANKATLSIYDVTGKVISTTVGDYSKGYNELKIRKSDLNNTGIIYYQLESGSFSATKKMIILE